LRLIPDLVYPWGCVPRLYVIPRSDATRSLRPLVSRFSDSKRWGVYPSLRSGGVGSTFRFPLPALPPARRSLLIGMQRIEKLLPRRVVVGPAFAGRAVVDQDRGRVSDPDVKHVDLQAFHRARDAQRRDRPDGLRCHDDVPEAFMRQCAGPLVVGAMLVDEPLSHRVVLGRVRDATPVDAALDPREIRLVGRLEYAGQVVCRAPETSHVPARPDLVVRRDRKRQGQRHELLAGGVGKGNGPEPARRLGSVAGRIEGLVVLAWRRRERQEFFVGLAEDDVL